MNVISDQFRELNYNMLLPDLYWLCETWGLATRCFSRKINPAKTGPFYIAI
jgi:hypothetical protein